MLCLAPHQVTTRNSASLYPFQVERGLPAIGPAIGLDHLAGGAKFCFDPWALYERRVITNANMVVLGQIGKGKSAFVKSYLARQALFGRQVFVLDPKGEYAPLAESLGLSRIFLVPGGQGGRVNPLDPGPLGDLDRVDLRRRRTEMLAALASTGLGRDLRPEERAALDAALQEAEATSDTPVLSEVVQVLLDPNAKLAKTLSTTKGHLGQAVRELSLELRRLVTGDLAGMFDGPTTTQVDWSGPGLVVDISAVHNTPALAPVMVCAATWLSQAVAAPSEAKRILVADELWSALRLVAVTRWLQAVAKLSRSYGIQLVVVAHRLSDFSAQGDEGSEAVRQALGLLADVETRVIYAQADPERQALASLLGLPAAEVDLATRLVPHRALWKVGRASAVVEHVLSRREALLCDTDAAMVDHG
jgi:hypothetical protein